MPVASQTIEYFDGDTVLRGQLAWEPSIGGLVPGVLVAHTWAGCGPFERRKAMDLAQLGYAALAVDLYGGGMLGSGPEQNAKLMAPLMNDRAKLQRRMQRALDTLKGLKHVDPCRTAAIGYCFGGLCVLDLARTGADLLGAVSFHGLLQPPGNTDGEQIRAKVLVLHGWGDPMAKPEHVEALAGEFTRAGADWQLHAYGHTMHAFTNPAANNPDMGTVYDAQADRRSWQAMRDFLEDVFAKP